MTAKLDFSGDAFLYAQALDNSGKSEYWHISDCAAGLRPLEPEDVRRRAIQESIDKLQATGRNWPIFGGGITCRVSWSGDCVITFRPTTRDADGRISPVLLICNVFSVRENQILLAWESIETCLHRELSQEDKSVVTHLARMLRWPQWLLFLNILIFSRSLKND